MNITPKLIIRYISNQWKDRILSKEIPLDIEKEAIELIEEYARQHYAKTLVSGNEANQPEIKKDGEEAVAFADWICKEGFDSKQIAVSLRWKKGYYNEREYTSKELYEMYEQEKAKATDR